jgi:hypothetical protein
VGRRLRIHAVAGAAGLAVTVLAAQAAGPAPGRYDATLCVATAASAPPSCGPVELHMRGPAEARLRIADVEYRLALRPTQLDVATMHGTMQIDEFSALYEWQGDELRFVDADKDVRYTVRVGKRRR